MKPRPKTKVKQDNQRGSEVMSYLFEEFNSGRTPLADKQIPEQELDIPSLKERVSFRPKAEAPDNAGDRKLRLLNKFSSDNVVEVKDPNEPTPFMRRPLNEHVKNYRDFIKSPLLDSAIVGSSLALGTWALDRYFNPITDTDILEEAAAIAKERKIQPSSDNVKQLKAMARSRLNRNKWIIPGIVGIIGSSANSWYHYKPGNWKSLFKFANAKLNKTASMFGPYDSMDINEVRSAVIDSSMTDGNKFLAMNMLGTIDKPMVTSGDIIGAAVNTGVSAVSGSPIGRYTVAAAANAAMGYSLGKLVGVSRPDRLAAATGIGSFLLGTLQPAKMD